MTNNNFGVDVLCVGCVLDSRNKVHSISIVMTLNFENSILMNRRPAAMCKNSTKHPILFFLTQTRVRNSIRNTKEGTSTKNHYFKTGASIYYNGKANLHKNNLVKTSSWLNFCHHHNVTNIVTNVVTSITVTLLNCN